MIRLKTHYRCTLAELVDRFSARELRELEIAERIVPFGEYAMTLRAEYLAHAFAASQGSKESAAAATEIMRTLLGE